MASKKKRHGTGIVLVFSFIVFPAFSRFEPPAPKDPILTLYQEIEFTGIEKPDLEVFHQGVAGYYRLKNTGKFSEKDILTVIDFRKSGNEKRLWVFDLNEKKVLYHSLVAHGRNSGELYASKFSNTPNSNQSSLGFYATGNTYIGKHGVSLKLHGLETGINDKAEMRTIVMHGAEYVSESFIKKNGRLGRSFGCPAIPMEIHKELIEQVAEGTCIFIYYPDKDYISTSRIVNDSLHHTFTVQSLTR